MIGYAELLSCWRRGMKNGNWYQLGAMDRIFYRAAMFYTELRNKIVNNRIIADLKIMPVIPHIAPGKVRYTV